MQLVYETFIVLFSLSVLDSRLPDFYDLMLSFTFEI
jgi:hypothetical protein